MARHTGPVCKLCRREGEKLFLKGARCLGPKCAMERKAYVPGEHGRSGQFRRNRPSNYLLQLREKQKARRIYGIYERQFSNYFERAMKSSGLTGTNLLMLLERRLDNVIYRLGLADSRAQARQLVNHGHITLNGRKTDIASALVSEGSEVGIRPESIGNAYFKGLRDSVDDRHVPRWISFDAQNLAARVIKLPAREDIDVTLNEQLIVEYYSR